ncbi:hypothetical protein NVP2275O_479 [Vibrio phage 2.275.O._10N.286.54.E11]|nr:hypothetical protein NVP2275O_479 [Vibrio phage 2.275.O._10N.286.54.E11]
MTRLTRSNGVFYSNIPERVVLGPNTNNKTITPINLIGQQHISYGKAQNENYVWLVENFASSTSPDHILGQTWYKPSTSNTGELLIAPNDNIGTSDWLTVPVISLVQAEPAISDSMPGRMIIQNNNSLKMLINGSWRTIPTRVSGEQYTERLLTIRYDPELYAEGEIVEINDPEFNGTGKPTLLVNSIRHNASWSNVARFNEGGAFTSLLDVPNGLTVSGTDALRFGGNYFWNAEVQAKDVRDPSKQKSWELSGIFNVDSSTTQVSNLPTDSSRYVKPDPRIVSGTLTNTTVIFDIVKTVELEDEGTEDWDVRVIAETEFPLLSDITDLSSGNIDVERYITNGDLYGIMFQGTTNESANLQWSIAFTVQGTPNTTIA